MRPALLVIDLQKEFFNLSQTCSDSLKSAIEYINEAIPLFRKKRLPIIVIQHMNEKGGLVPGNPVLMYMRALNSSSKTSE